MKTLMMATTLCLTGILAADEIPRADTTTWFNETYQNFRETSATQWDDSAGRWVKKDATDKSAFADGCVQLDTHGRELTFNPRPTGHHVYSHTNAYVKVQCRMSFTAAKFGEEWDVADRSMKAAIGIREKMEDGTLTFIGWRSSHDGSIIKGRWTDLSATGVTPEEETLYDVTIERDDSCVPSRVRYSVNGQPLADSLGNSWFSVSGGTLDPSGKNSKYLQKVAFRGRGEVANFSATMDSARAERAAVTLDAGARPLAGSTLSFTATAIEGKTFGEVQSSTWYRVDAAGMKQAVLGADATYTLTAADYGHWVTVEVSDENGYAGTGKFWCSDLPVVEMEVGTADGYVRTEDETARPGETYYYADEGDNFFPLEIEEGADLAPYRDQYETLFVEEIAYTWPTSKKETHSGKITIRGNAEYDDQVTNMKFTIHVRGNSTAGQDKKPYKIKLDKKTDLFGLGGGVKNKHWVLLANCFDESLMRNKLCYDLSGQFGAPVWMKSEWVDVVMNGKYVGNYQLCQHIRVSDERIPILNWDTGDVAEAAQKANPALTNDDVDLIDEMLETNCLWMTSGTFAYGGTNYVLSAKKADGGTLDGQGRIKVYWKAWNGGDISKGLVFEIDSKKMPKANGGTAPAPSSFIQKHTVNGTLQLCVAMNTPEYAFTNPTISNFVWETWWNIGEAWMSGTNVNARGEHYADLGDFDSMVSYWLSQFVPGNDDSGSFSRYSYLRDSDGKMVFAPAWDFDYGLGSLQIRIRSAVTTNAYGQVHYAPIQPEKWIPARSQNNFMGHWTADPYFTFKLRERYFATRPYLADMVKEGGLIDQYKAKLAASARANDLRWNNRIGFWGDADEPGDVDVLKQFLTRRFAWLDGQFATVGSAVTNVSQTVNAAALRYARNAALAPTFTGAQPTAGSVETDVADMTATVVHAPVAGTVAVPSGATTLDVYVNGRFAANVPVSSGSASIELPAAAFKSGETNFLAFISRDASGAVKAKNVALLACSLPEVVAEADGGHDVPIAWLAEAWSDLAAAGSTAARPVSYDDYLVFATNASPIGKSVPLWEDFVAGTSPTNVNEKFTADITIGTDGVPSVSWHPEQSYGQRRYTLKGAPALEGPWAETDATAPAADFTATNRFFKVEVELP